MRDRGDEEVKGLDRFIPTRRAVVLLVATVTTPPGIFAFLVSQQSFLFYGTHESARIPLIAAITFGWAIIVLACLCVELSIALNHSKHRKITHFSNEHSQMSFQWIFLNATTKHYLFIAFVFLFGLVLGRLI
ncbi:hypothetical protein ABMA57_02290 [Saccharospirillum sp. HFRX-1]|uniref:hypothetical protein n=1 Tax=unclassified Saccharospirillum TaxID=2633430 RepID=UPI0037216823